MNFKKKVIFSIILTILIITTIEILIRFAYIIRSNYVEYIITPYVIGHDWGPIPPWRDWVNIVDSDEYLIWKNKAIFNAKYLIHFKPSNTENDRLSLVRRFSPYIPKYLKDFPTFEVKTNKEGFRDVEFSLKKDPSIFRILCIGDSWTFGLNVNKKDSYPDQLNALLSSSYPEEKFEVYNLGVGGYASIHGLKILRKKINLLKPDLIIIGFALNEPSMHGFTEDSGNDISKSNNNLQSNNINKRVQNFVDYLKQASLSNFEIFKLLNYWALLLEWEPQEISDALIRSHVYGGNEDQFVHSPDESWFKDSLLQYKKNILKMINIAKLNGTDVILLYTHFVIASHYLNILKEISDSENIALVNSSLILSDKRREIEEKLEKELKIEPLEFVNREVSDYKEVVFRVYVEKSYDVPDTIYITGTNENLGNLVPNVLKMYDDGTNSDQKAGDRVWSLSVTIPKEAKIYYLYTNSGSAKKWAGLDLPDVRKLAINNNETQNILYKPIDTFGTIYLKSDP